MQNILEYVDIFGTKFNFNVNERDTFKTPLGGFLTILTIGLIVFFSFFFGTDFYYKVNPIIFSNTIVPDRYEDPILLTPENLVIAWRIEDPFSLKISTDKVIYPIQRQSYFKSNAQGDLDMIYIKDLPITTCNENNAKMKEFTEFNKLENWNCFDWSEEEKRLGGFWDGDYVLWYQLYLYLCDKGVEYSSSNPNCTNLEDYWKFETKHGGGLAISFMYPEYYLSAEDTVNPLRIFYKNYYYFFSPNTYKIDRFFFNKITLFDDQGWIFEDIRNKTLLSINKIQDDQNINNIKDGKSSQMYEFNLYVEKASKTFKRSYTKIQDVGAKVGGMIKVILVIFGFLNSFFSSHKLNLSIFYRVFDFDSKVNHGNQSNKQG